MTPAPPSVRLTVAVAVRDDDHDGAYFTALALRLHHPEAAGRCDLLVVDGDPDGPGAPALRGLPWLRYATCEQVRGSALRDLAVREARTEWVLCVDSGALLAPGALARLLAFADARPGTRDLFQGPLLDEDLRTVRTHRDPVFDGASFGMWGCDPRGTDADAPPFEIGMQDLGLFACRRDAWPGFNPRLRGHGAEEGYLHKKYRAAGARVLCLPFLRWTRRPRDGSPDPAAICRDRLLAWEEAGLAVEPVVDHCREAYGDVVDGWVAGHAAERSHPLDYFDAMLCVNSDAEPSRWVAAARRFGRLGADGLVRRLPAVAGSSPGVGYALSHRRAVELARRRGLEHVLVFEDDVTFCRDAEVLLRGHVGELADRRWTVCRLGDGAVAYHGRVFERLLAEVPGGEGEVAVWVAAHGGWERYVDRRFGEGVVGVVPAVTARA
ncbi:hypothetical protein I5Q34_29060 [Streptomyces sp. AV19]|uniref:hypothetical protein n=1 Tax=Streptomyces sp. AV19 TaxID=2793068 RepID=UPI0018FE7ED3|nr:hypothetical protein [Streptomyces sp. AV19]MBH1938261.1 hypothetical protein [Streptomyces sp. AV19]MDG4534891.1 hypothetical protein [Streptomyces sp. AV19]